MEMLANEMTLGPGDGGKTLPKTMVGIDKKKFVTGMDGGSDKSFIKPSILVKLGYIFGKSNLMFRGIKNSSLVPVGHIMGLVIEIGGVLMPHDFEIAENIRYDILIGRDWMIATKCLTSWTNGHFSFEYNGKKGMIYAYQEVSQMVAVCQHVTIQSVNEDDLDDEYEEIEEDSENGEILHIEQETIQICTQQQWMEVVTHDAAVIPIESYNGTELKDQEALELSEEHIPDLKIGSDVTEDQQMKLGEILMKYSKQFAYQLEDLERCAIDPLVIDLQDSAPIKVKAYRIPIAQSMWLQDELKRLEQLDFIRRCFGPWATSIFLVPKKDGKWRIVQDFRPINRLTKKDAGAVPIIAELLD